MFNQGEYILYGGTGVCRVQQIVSKRLRPTDSEQKYYVLEPLYQPGTIMAPVDSEKVFMRPIIDKEEALALIDSIPEIEVRPYHNQNLQQLESYYRSQLQNHDCRSLLMLTMSAYRKKEEREKARQKFGAVDRRYMERAENLLFGELAVALNINRDNVRPFIEERLFHNRDV